MRSSARREALDLRLARGVLDHGRPVGERRRHHQLLRRADGREVEHDARAVQPLGLGLDVAVADARAGRPSARGRPGGGRPGARRSRSRRASRRARGRSAPAAGRASGTTRASSSPGRTAPRCARRRAPRRSTSCPSGLSRDVGAEVAEHRERGADVGERRHVAAARSARGVSSVAKSSGRAAFFEPLTTTSPSSAHAAADHDAVHCCPPPSGALRTDDPRDAGVVALDHDADVATIRLRRVTHHGRRLSGAHLEQRSSRPARATRRASATSARSGVEAVGAARRARAAARSRAPRARARRSSPRRT